MISLRPFARAVQACRGSVAIAAACAVLAGSAACARRVVPGPAARDAAWWWWPSTGAPQNGPSVPLVYVLSGTLDTLARSRWPASVPPAARYVLVWRGERRAVPTGDTVRPLVAAYTRVTSEARAAGASVGGLQIDIDVPTASLRSYAVWLDTVRRALPPGTTLSVTGLLDWFRDGTAIARVADAVDEVVPQFYDIEPRSTMPGIAHPVDLATWLPRLEALERPYRLGLATFGRIERVESVNGRTTRLAYRDLTPLDLVERFTRLGDVAATAGRERVVTFIDPSAGPHRRTYQLLVPPADAVGSGHALMAACGRWCAGVAFFRWPAAHESLVVGPRPEKDGHGNRVPTLDVEPMTCAPLWCADVTLVTLGRFPEHDAEIVLESSTPVRLVQAASVNRTVAASPRALVIRVPAWHGQARLPLGRIFTDRPARFSLQVPPDAPAPRSPPSHR